MAAQTKAKTAQNGAGKKLKAQPSASSTDTSTPVTTTATTGVIEPVTYGIGKPEKSLYDAEQEKIKTEIEAAQKKLNAVKDKIGVSNKGGPAQERRNELLEELKKIRGEQGNIKQTRAKVFEQLNVMQENIQKKIKELNAQKSKVQFKTVADVDATIAKLEKQVESGSMKVADEKRALADISQYKRSRRIVEGFQTEQASIDTERAAADELRKQLDDPEGKAMAERYDELQAELDELKKAGDEAHAARGKLLDERTALQAQLDELYNQKRDGAARFREAQDRYWAKVNGDRARRAERARQQRQEDEERKKREVAERIREEAEVPAFQANIEDCQTLIEYFSGKSSAPAKLSTDEKKPRDVVGVPGLDIRKVDAGPGEGMVVRKKKGEEQDTYFVGGGGKKKGGKKGGAKGESAANGTDAPSSSSSSSSAVQVPMATLSALLSLSIPPPASQADLPRVVENLKEKKAWYAANQARVTAENKAKAERDIARLTGKQNDAPEATMTVAVVAAPDEGGGEGEGEELTPPNGGGERPAEPAPTPAVDDTAKSLPVPEEEVEEKLESVQEENAAEEQS